MNNVEVVDYKGRKLTLFKHHARITNGSRYITRKSVAKMLYGFTNKVWGGSEFTTPGLWKWTASSGINHVRFGCHIFRNQNAKLIKEWAIPGYYD